MLRLKLVPSSTAFALILGLLLAAPMTPAPAEGLTAFKVPDFCLGQCGPLLFPNPPDFPDYTCDGNCSTFLCECFAIELTDANGKTIGIACNCNPNTIIFG